MAAPAENLVGGLPGGGYAEWAGTSGATPIVAGVAALIRSKWPDMSAKQVINRIVSTAKDAGPPGKDPLYGFGVLNAEAALKDRVPEAAANPLGSISDWIRVHRRGNLATPRPGRRATSSAVPTLPMPTVPVAVPPSQRDTPCRPPSSSVRRPVRGDHRGGRVPVAQARRAPADRRADDPDTGRLRFGGFRRATPS